MILYRDVFCYVGCKVSVCCYVVVCRYTVFEFIPPGNFYLPKGKQRHFFMSVCVQSCPWNAMASLPFVEISGPNILPDDIFNLGLEEYEIKDNTPQIVGSNVRDRNAPNVDEDDFERRVVKYDLDSIGEMSRDRDIAPGEFETLLKDLDDIYISPFKEKNDLELRQYIYKLWDLEDLIKEGIVELKDIRKGYEKNLSQILKIYMLFLRNKMVGKDGPETIWNQNLFNRALKSVYYMENILVSEYHIRKNIEDENCMFQEDRLDIFRFTPEDVSKNKPFQNLLVYLLKRAYQKGYRLYREACYKQIYHNGYPTHAWKYVMPILAFVYDSISRETNGEMWRNLTDSRDNAKRAVDYLLNAKDKELPTLDPDRHLFAWTDGLYDAKTLQFYPYEEYTLPSDRVAIKFFEQPFKVNELFNVPDWYEIQTPALEKILEHQEFSPDVCKIIYAMMGRCLYDVNEIDHWEIILFIKGVAGSGKSTIGKILKDFYPAADVAVLSSNIERKFGLGAIFDKLMFLCFEVKATWGLDQGDFQCMISGEEIPVAIKHKTAVTTLWKVPGMLMGNEVARSWQDAAGSMTRRVLVAEFNKRVKNTDTTLGKQLKEQLAAILHKCNMAYHDLVRTCGSANIWNKIPQYFIDTQKHFAGVINPLEDFLGNCDVIRVDSDDPTCCIPYEEFQIMYLNFCRKNNYDKGIRFNKDHYQTVFEVHGIQVKQEPEKEYKGMTKHDIKWIYGVGLREEDGCIDND